MCVIYIRFYRACVVQGLDRKTLPYCGWFQPYGAWAGLSFVTFVLIFYGYSAFTPWDVGSFFTYYGMAGVAIITFTSWKLIHKTRLIPPEEVDLTWEKPAIDAYEAACDEVPVGFWVEILILFGLRRKPKAVSSA